MKTNCIIVIWLAVLVVATTGSAQTFTLLRSFAGAPNEGANPMGSLILSNGTLYGMTSQGGVAGGGEVFRMSTNGGSVTNLHSFSAYAGNGLNPSAALILSGSTLYGMTGAGSYWGAGLVFRVNTDGRAYTNLHSFTGGATNGSIPYGSLTLVSGKLYGMTMHGGTSDLGVLFRINTDGSGYTNLHVFTGGATNGAWPSGDLVVSGTTFYGLTSQGGTNNLGTVFCVNTDGSGYTNLHSFAGYPNEGASPPRSLTLDGSTLYGVAQSGGAANLGVVFKLNTDGGSYTNLHSFAGGTGDGATPDGSLTLANGSLYGMTSVGGASNLGVLFRVSTDGGSYTNVHSFAGGTGDGASPSWCSLMLDSSTLYGMTYYGGTNNDGVVFALSNLPAAPPPTLAIMQMGTQAIISWDATVTGWMLQTNANLATLAWGNYLGAVVNNRVTNAPPKGNVFFRLKQ
jgi:uncharacterized repeat protein (TIGR03803 family)